MQRMGPGKPIRVAGERLYGLNCWRLHQSSPEKRERQGGIKKLIFWTQASGRVGSTVASVEKGRELSTLTERIRGCELDAEKKSF